MCYRRESNPHALTGTRLSTLRVYQFRHDSMSHSERKVLLQRNSVRREGELNRFSYNDEFRDFVIGLKPFDDALVLLWKDPEHQEVCWTAERVEEPERVPWNVDLSLFEELSADAFLLRLSEFEEAARKCQQPLLR